MPLSPQISRLLGPQSESQIDAHTIRVWSIPLAAAKLPPEFDKLLSAQEQLHAARFHFSKDAVRFKLCRALLRLGLAAQLHVDPADIALTTGPQGKPLLAGASSLHFNVSHCEDMALFAFAACGEIGVDVESYRSNLEAQELAQAYFTPAEAVLVSSAPDEPQQVRRFLRLWTRKEAVLKAAGCGLLQDLNTFDVSGGAIQLVDLPAGTNRPHRRWQIRDLELGSSAHPVSTVAQTNSDTAQTSTLFAALAAPEGDWKLEQFTLSPAALYQE